MSTLNGIGTRFLGYTYPDRDGSCYATKWITFIYLPLIPLSRNKIIRNSESKTNEFEFVLILKEKLIAKEIFQTYFWNYIVVLTLIFGPLLIMIYCKVFDSKDEGLIIPSVFLYTFWFGFWIIILKRWDEERGLPLQKRKSILFRWFKII